MRVTVLSPGSGWILDTIAQRTCEADPAHFTHATVVETKRTQQLPGADAILYWDVQSCFMQGMAKLQGVLHVGAFTHLDRDTADSFRPHWRGLHGVIHMCERYRAVFVQHGWWPAERMTVLRPGEPAVVPFRRKRIGICQRGGHEGKGHDFLPQVVARLRPEERAALEFVFCGQGWLTPAEEMAGVGFYGGVAARCVPEEDYRSLYSQIDVLLIPSLWEGGPMCFPEALAAGLEIYAAEVGWVEDLVMEAPDEMDYVYTFRPGDVEGCAFRLHALVHHALGQRRVAESMTYAQYATDVLAFCHTLQEMRA